MAWVTLDELKDELDADDDRDDEKLQRTLDAVVVFVEHVRKGHFNFDGDPLSELPAPSADLKLGALMLARRLHTRRRSPDGLVAMGEMGSARVASFDPDIDRLLRLGRHAKARMG